MRSTSGQYCMMGFDPCGRSFESSTAYESQLLADNTTTNKCVRSPNNDETDPSTVLISGNICESGWCDNNFKCVTTNPNIGRNCDNSVLATGNCAHASDCPGSPTTCSIPNYRCQFTSGTSANADNPCVVGSSCESYYNNCVAGRCSKSGDDCTSSPCPTTGTCALSTGTCQEPTNRTCSCEPGGEVFCPVANTCLVNSLTTNPAGRNSNCSPLPPQPPACEWVETSRTPCSGACGQSGTLTINRACRVVGSGTACGTCAGSSTITGVSCTSAPCSTGVNVETRVGACFTKDTPITVADGSTVPIQDIQVGDQVMIYDEVKKIKTISEVTEINHHKPELREFYKIDFENNKSVTVTGDHYIFDPIANRYSPAETIYENWMRSQNFYLLNFENELEQIKMITTFMNILPSYNLHVRGISSNTAIYGHLGRGHNYYANGILAHNMKWVCEGGCNGLPGCHCMSHPPLIIRVQCNSSDLEWNSENLIHPYLSTPGVTLSGSDCTNNPRCGTSCASPDGSTANMGSQYCVTSHGPTCVGYSMGICFCPGSDPW